MFYSNFKRFVKDEFKKLWRLVNPLDARIEEIEKTLDGHKLYRTRGFLSLDLEEIHHKKINDRLDKLEKDCRKTISNCSNKACPHHNKEALTHCDKDPFECKKYKTGGLI